MTKDCVIAVSLLNFSEVEISYSTPKYSTLPCSSPDLPTPGTSTAPVYIKAQIEQQCCTTVFSHHKYVGT